LQKVVPILKSGDNKIPTNYEQIPVPTYLSKVFEKRIVTVYDDFTKKQLVESAIM